MTDLDNFRTTDWSKELSNTGYFIKEAEEILEQIEKLDDKVG